MVVYYHTSRYIYAVANGYVASIKGVDGSDCPVSLVGAKLLHGLDEQLAPVATAEVALGQRLKFELNDVGLISDRVILIQPVASLSIPPTARPSYPPESYRVRDPIPTVPEVILPKRDG